jgi:hypothetical protein
MNENEYKARISEQNMLGYSTLHITLIELAARKEDRLITAIQRILQNNVVPKPEHLPNDQGTNVYQVDLPQDDIEKIRDMFLDLEAHYVDENGVATPTAAFYASLVAKWEGLMDYN